MNTSILSVFFAGALLADAAPKWQDHYGQAVKIGTQQNKPLVVVFGSGANGMTKLVRDGAISAEANRLLKDMFVCVYIDTATTAGKSLALSFEITGNIGIVISDRDGALQAFWHQGDMTNQILVGTLQKYSNAQRIAQTTETGTGYVSYYQSGENGGSASGSIVQTGYSSLMNSQGGIQLSTPQVSNCLT